MSLAFTDANYAKVAQDGLIRQRRFPRQPGATNLRIVVRDVASGSVGSLTIPFNQIPPGGTPAEVARVATRSRNPSLPSNHA